ncbi:MAG: hypothetical protein GXP49_05125 [Deltaproteobacteria bacterium]|nr:hypothetical protein [Deltaproteobacteria bacterium]
MFNFGTDSNMEYSWNEIFFGRFSSFMLSMVVLLSGGNVFADEQGGPGPSLFYKDGFVLKFGDTESERFFSLRIRTAMEFRYTYAFTDHDTEGYNLVSTGKRPGNANDYSAFDMRRLRLYMDGRGPTDKWRYYIHVQLEPQSAVNANDGYVEYDYASWLKARFGRMKIPAFGLEFWQSGFKLNGTDRTIFTGDSENDKDMFGTRTYDFPSGNARLRVGNHTLANGFSTGGMTLYRSQGLCLMGNLDAGRKKQVLSYSFGVFNGRDTRGFNGLDKSMLVAGRLGINLLSGSDPAGPLASHGLSNFTMQGDMGLNRTPLLSMVVSGFFNRARVPYIFVADPVADGFMSKKDLLHWLKNYGFSATLLFRWQGFSADLDAAWEEFIQEGASNAVWDRWAGRMNLGHFLVPGKLEVTVKLAYLVRLNSSRLQNSLASGLGLVKRESGWTVENGLMESRVGLNWYMDGFRQMMAVDISWLRARLGAVSQSEANSVLGLSEASFKDMFAGNSNVENDVRLRVMYQYIF